MHEESQSNVCVSSGNNPRAGSERLGELPANQRLCGAQQIHAGDVRRRTRLRAGVGLQRCKENEMSPERGPPRSAHCRRHGGKSMTAISHRAVYIAAQWSRCRFPAASSAAVPLQFRQVASFRAQLRSSLSERPSVWLTAASSLAVSRRVAFCSPGAALPANTAFLRSTSLPNMPLVSTAHPLARVGTRATGAAALGGTSGTQSSLLAHAHLEHV